MAEKQYNDQLKEFAVKATKLFDELRKEAFAQERNIISQARAQAANIRETNNTKISEEISQIKSQLVKQINQFATDLEDKLTC